jgi:hypothetical protein
VQEDASSVWKRGCFVVRSLFRDLSFVLLRTMVVIGGSGNIEWNREKKPVSSPDNDRINSYSEDNQQ